jgi:hypothetical protein
MKFSSNSVEKVYSSQDKNDEMSRKSYRRIEYPLGTGENFFALTDNLVRIHENFLSCIVNCLEIIKNYFA